MLKFPALTFYRIVEISITGSLVAWGVEVKKNAGRTFKHGKNGTVPF